MVVTTNRHFTANFVFVDGVGEEATHPNPANDVVYVKGKGIRKVTVINMQGQVMEDRETEGMDEIQINVQG